MSSLAARAAAMAASTGNAAASRLLGAIAGDPVSRLPPIARKVFLNGPLASAEGRAIAVRAIPGVLRLMPYVGMAMLLATLAAVIAEQLAAASSRRRTNLVGHCATPEGGVNRYLGGTGVGIGIAAGQANDCTQTFAFGYPDFDPAVHDYRIGVYEHEHFGTKYWRIQEVDQVLGYVSTPSPGADTDASPQDWTDFPGQEEPERGIARVAAEVDPDLAPWGLPLSRPMESGRELANLRRRIADVVEEVPDPAVWPFPSPYAPVRVAPPIEQPAPQRPVHVLDEWSPTTGSVVVADAAGRPVDAVAVEGGSLPAPPFYSPSSHTFEPGGKRERKISLKGKALAWKAVINAYTETHDFIRALWQALPRGGRNKRGRRWGVTRLDSMVEDLWKNWDLIDWREATMNVFANHTEDAVIGRVSGMLDRASLNSGMGLDSMIHGGYGMEGFASMIGAERGWYSDWVNQGADRLVLNRGWERDAADRRIRERRAEGKPAAIPQSYLDRRARQHAWSRDNWMGVRPWLAR